MKKIFMCFLLCISLVTTVIAKPKTIKLVSITANSETDAVYKAKRKYPEWDVVSVRHVVKKTYRVRMEK